MKSFLDLNIKGKSSDDEHYMWSINNYIKDAENIVLILVNNSRLNEAEKLLAEAGKDIEENKIINGLKVLKEKYLANQPVHLMPKADALK